MDFKQGLTEAVRLAEGTGLTGPEKKEWAKRWLKENVERLDDNLGAWLDFPLVDWLESWALDLAVEWAWGQMASALKGA